MFVSTPVRTDRPAYRPYTAEVVVARRLSPSFLRLTLHSEDFGVFGTDGLDQRIKLVLPLPGLPGAGFSDFGQSDQDQDRDQDPDADPALALPRASGRNPAPAPSSWYERWRGLPDEHRNPLRTYTVRRVDLALRLLDVDVVVHDDSGPAGTWAQAARPGDQVVVIGPDARSIHSATGIDFHPGTARHLLLVGDETALPAIAAILEACPDAETVHCVLEVPTAADVLALDTLAGTTISWASRDRAFPAAPALRTLLAHEGGPSPRSSTHAVGHPRVGHGETLLPRVRAWADAHADLLRHQHPAAPQELEDIDVDRDLLWDSPEAPGSGDFYAWIAGEAAAVTSMRRFLVRERGVDRSRVAFMGYWRQGRSERS